MKKQNKNSPMVEDRGELSFSVASEVVGHLSHGLYRDFPRAVKELISNAYDADATEVKIRLDLDNKQIIIRDNGKGMTKDDIEHKYLRIGQPTPPTEKRTALGRKRIGTFGIGCLSVFPYCETIKLISKRANTNSIIEIEIKASKFFGRGGELKGKGFRLLCGMVR